MTHRLDHPRVRALAKGLRNLTGRHVSHTAILDDIAASIGQRTDAMMHRLKQPTADGTAPETIHLDPSAMTNLVDRLRVRSGPVTAAGITVMSVDAILNPSNHSNPFATPPNDPLVSAIMSCLDDAPMWDERARSAFAGIVRAQAQARPTMITVPTRPRAYRVDLVLEQRDGDGPARRAIAPMLVARDRLCRLTSPFGERFDPDTFEELRTKAVWFKLDIETDDLMEDIREACRTLGVPYSLDVYVDPSDDFPMSWSWSPGMPEERVTGLTPAERRADPNELVDRWG